MRRQFPAKADERPTFSYLVRFWPEPRDDDRDTPPLRVYARDLKTGEERYFGDPRRFAEHILRVSRAARENEVSDHEEVGRRA